MGNTKRVFNKIILMAIMVLSFNKTINSQTQVFFDNFEAGTAKWVLTGSWGSSTTNFYSSAKSLTESPTGNYANNLNISATSINIDLSTYKGAELSFWAKYNIENAFDFMYLEASKDGGASYFKIKEFTGVSSTWKKYTFNLGTFAGYSNVKIRFRFYADQYVVADGMYIDDVEVMGLNTDTSEPLIVHNAPEHYEGTLGDFIVTAEITDVSGINSATLYYLSDGAGPYSVTGTNIGGDEYSFTIPAQTPGKSVSYKIKAVDNANPANGTDTSAAPKYKFISGSYLKYDNGMVDAVATITGVNGAAVKISVPNGLYGFLVTALIRNYTDPNILNSNMLFHVWSNNNGVPGTDLITPITVTPEATQDNPFPFTRIDLRSFSSQLSDLTGDFFIGYTVPSGSASMVVSSSSNGRSYNYNGTSWSSYSQSYEMRAIIFTSATPLPVELTTFSANVNNNKVQLNWETATEVNNYGFEVERQNAEVSSQKSEWEKVGFVEGHGNSNSPKFYQYSDASLNTSGKYYYRLKQIDIDGKYEYSEMVEINISSPDDFSLSQNYPNPFNPTTKIKYSIPSNNLTAGNNGDVLVTLKIYDILGKEIKTLVNENQSAGIYEVDFNAHQLSSGMYFYTLQAGEFRQTNKMILTK
ncbi:MAG: T9SS type A sorting domain-containing protein [Ignavibacteriae bacterium]|nr:T9SS type A sorting domain-containing protein [Ignavibacteriota bacterium]